MKNMHFRLYENTFVCTYYIRHWLHRYLKQRALARRIRQHQRSDELHGGVAGSEEEEGGRHAAQEVSSLSGGVIPGIHIDREALVMLTGIY